MLAERDSLVNELKILESETVKFNEPLAEALAKAEIADAAWQLDRSWAKKLLRSAFELMLPSAEQKQDRPVGSIPPTPVAVNRSSQKVRHRVLAIAGSDREFVNELIQLEAERLGAFEKQFTPATLADQALGGGDVKTSSDYILKGIEPTRHSQPRPHLSIM